MIEGDQAVETRLARVENSQCSPEVMEILHQTITDCNPYAAAYSNMADVEQEQQRIAAVNNQRMLEVRMVFRTGHDERRYNAPVHDEVAAVFVGQQGAPPTNHDVVVYPRGQPLRSISFMNPNLDPMVYPLLFPRGELGWSSELRHVEERRTAERNKVTQL